jgi:hypothetical protein
LFRFFDREVEWDHVISHEHDPTWRPVFGPGVLDLGQVVLEGWKAPGSTLSEVGSLWGHFDLKGPVWTH